ncbi:MAG: YafY family transcriptional regulator [Spirochaetaceae bacterium]|jgi:predicted DNA-binding transcriptional regulator YafY|nr:YafY family transcriptional regulator [Spirochaetaceae bacterium]
MKAERLLAILTILLNREKVTAPWLAKRFEVSVRTIYRDLEALAQAGIPVYATPGREGGIELVEGFRLNTQLLEPTEVQRILTGLESIQHLVQGMEFEKITEKFSLMLKESKQRGIRAPGNHIFIELVPSRREKGTINLIEQSISGGELLSIRYTDISGRVTERVTEPLALIYIWQSWFLYAYCRLREGFRPFRITRIAEPQLAPGIRIAPETDISDRPWLRDWENSNPPERIVFSIDETARSRAAEMFDEEVIQALPDGWFRITVDFPIDEWIISYIISLPGQVRVEEPDSLRRAVALRAAEMARNNRQDRSVE